MKLKKVVFLLLAPILVEMLIACCECNEPPPYDFVYNDFSIINIDNSGKEPVESVESEIAKNAYGIRLKFTTLLATTTPHFGPLFLSSAMANDCCPPPYESRDRIKSLKIISLYDFDDSHKAGADVSAYFKIYQNSSYAPVTDIVEDNELLYNSFVDKKNIYQDILLMTAPTFPLQQFRVKIAFLNGKEQFQTTTFVNLR